MYDDLFIQSPEAYLLIMIISLVITIFAYAAFPLIFAKIRKNPITKKKYRGICYGINAIVMVGFMILNGGVSNGAPYALWTWLFSRRGIKMLNAKGLLIDDEWRDDDPNRVTECKSCGYRDENYFNACPKCGKHAKRYVYLNEETIGVSEKIHFCRKCGEKLIDNSKFCSKCGTEVVKED